MRTQLPQARAGLDSHPGLLLQRYVAHPADGSEQWSQAKRDIHAAARGVVPCELYKTAFTRWEKSLAELNAASIVLQTAPRLIVGLGSENVLETGIRLHHTYGLPIIPGSALKGLAAHYCDQIWGPTDEKFRMPTKSKDAAYRKFLAGDGRRAEDNFHRLIFGNTDDNGCIVFHDAWFVPDSQKDPLKLDVMTPHHSDWNNVDNPKPPTDFDSPVPVPFLSVAGNFLVAVSWHGPISDQAGKWTELALSLLGDALRDWGVGGKTTSGYGRLAALDDALVPRSPETEQIVAPASPPAETTSFRYDKADEVQVIKFIDDKGKPKFRTPDGLIAHAGAEDVADIPENVPVKLWVKNRNLSPKGYTLTRTRPSANPNNKSANKRKGKGK